MSILRFLLCVTLSLLQCSAFSAICHYVDPSFFFSFIFPVRDRIFSQMFIWMNIFLCPAMTHSLIDYFPFQLLKRVARGKHKIGVIGMRCNKFFEFIIWVVVFLDHLFFHPNHPKSLQRNDALMWTTRYALTSSATYIQRTLTEHEMQVPLGQRLFS